MSVKDTTLMRPREFKTFGKPSEEFFVEGEWKTSKEMAKMKGCTISHSAIGYRMNDETGYYEDIMDCIFKEGKTSKFMHQDKMPVSKALQNQVDVMNAFKPLTGVMK